MVWSLGLGGSSGGRLRARSRSVERASERHLWCNRHLRIFTRGHELNSMGKTHESDERTGGRRRGPNERERRQLLPRSLARLVDDRRTEGAAGLRPTDQPTFAHLSSSLRIRIDNDRRNGHRGPTGRPRPGYGHMQGRERRGCQNMLKTTPKPRNNGLRTCTFSPHHDSSPKANTTRASRPATAGDRAAARPVGWTRRTRSSWPRRPPVRWHDERARRREPSFYVFRSKFFATLS